MSLREFAAHLGVSDRMISKWEAGGERINGEPVWLPAFYIDIYPTSNADYARFVIATGHPPPVHWSDGRCPNELRDHPVVFVTWHDRCIASPDALADVRQYYDT